MCDRDAQNIGNAGLVIQCLILNRLDHIQVWSIRLQLTEHVIHEREASFILGSDQINIQILKLRDDHLDHLQFCHIRLWIRKSNVITADSVSEQLSNDSIGTQIASNERPQLKRPLGRFELGLKPSVV